MAKYLIIFIVFGIMNPLIVHTSNKDINPKMSINVKLIKASTNNHNFLVSLSETLRLPIVALFENKSFLLRKPQWNSKEENVNIIEYLKSEGLNCELTNQAMSLSYRRSIKIYHNTL